MIVPFSVVRPLSSVVCFRAWRSLVALPARTREVVGSNPTALTISDDRRRTTEDGSIIRHLSSVL